MILHKRIVLAKLNSHRVLYGFWSDRFNGSTPVVVCSLDDWQKVSRSVAPGFRLRLAGLPQDAIADFLVPAALDDEAFMAQVRARVSGNELGALLIPDSGNRPVFESCAVERDSDWFDLLDGWRACPGEVFFTTSPWLQPVSSEFGDEPGVVLDVQIRDGELDAWAAEAPSAGLDN